MSIINIQKNKKAFTLLEVILYVIVVGIVLFAISLLIGLLFTSRVKNTVIAEVEQQGVQIMDLITQTARNAESITSPGAGSSSGVLILDVVNGANDPTQFDLDSSRVRITEGAGSPTYIINDNVTVSGLTFTNLTRASTPGTIRIEFTITYSSSSLRNEYTYSKTFYGTATLR